MDFPLSSCVDQKVLSIIIVFLNSLLWNEPSAKLKSNNMHTDALNIPDTVKVDLEMLYNNVTEDMGVVEVCAVLESPNNSCVMPFNVSISTNDITGIHCVVWLL